VAVHFSEANREVCKKVEVKVEVPNNRDQTDVIPHSSEVESSANLSTDATITQELLTSSSSDSFSKLLGFLPRNGLYGAARYNISILLKILIRKRRTMRKKKNKKLKKIWMLTNLKKAMKVKKMK
jgi:hypothetical protein